MSTYTELLLNAAGLKADDLPDTLPSTLLKAIGGVVGSISNPNLLINPDFKINQRGQTEYIGSNEKIIYTVDGWKILQYSPNIKVTVNDGYITLENSGDETQYVAQSLENPIDDAHTISAKMLGNDNVLSGNKIATDDFTIMYERANNWLSIHIAAHTAVSLEWVKTEYGSVATPFVPPNLATELAKCQRYYRVINSLVAPCRGVGAEDISYYQVNLGVPMRTIPSVQYDNIHQLQGNNASAELNVRTSPYGINPDTLALDITGIPDTYKGCAVTIGNVRLSAEL